MNYLKMLGYITLIIGSYFIAIFIISMPFGVFYGIMHETSGMTISIEQFMSDSIIPITIAGSALAVVFFWLILMAKKESFIRFTKTRTTSLNNILIAILVGLGIYSLLYGILSFINVQQTFPEYMDFVSMIMSQENLLLTILSFGLVVPIFEEIMYRGIIFNLLRENMSLTLALFFQALIFAIMHMNMLQGGYTFLGGILIGLAYYWTGSLWVPILIHVSWNTSSLIIANLLTEATAPVINISAIIVAVLIIAASLLYYQREGNAKEKAIIRSS